MAFFHRIHSVIIAQNVSTYRKVILINKTVNAELISKIEIKRYGRIPGTIEND